MTELQQHRYDALVRRVGDLKGPGSKVAEVLTELFPTFDVENLPGELYLLGGTNICFGGVFLAAVAGQAPTAQLFNPVDSSVLATITSVHVGLGALSNIRWGITIAQRGTVIATQTFRDVRLLTPAAPVCQVSQETAVALASGLNQTRTAGNVNFTLTDPNGVAVLPPGSGFEIGGNTQNQVLACSFYWRERVAEPSELNL